MQSDSTSNSGDETDVEVAVQDPFADIRFTAKSQTLAAARTFYRIPEAANGKDAAAVVIAIRSSIAGGSVTARSNKVIMEVFNIPTAAESNDFLDRLGWTAVKIIESSTPLAQVHEYNLHRWAVVLGGDPTMEPLITRDFITSRRTQRTAMTTDITTAKVTPPHVGAGHPVARTEGERKLSNRDFLALSSPGVKLLCKRKNTYFENRETALSLADHMFAEGDIAEALALSTTSDSSLTVAANKRVGEVGFGPQQQQLLKSRDSASAAVFRLRS
jgi:hypothetical protein